MKQNDMLCFRIVKVRLVAIISDLDFSEVRLTVAGTVLEFGHVDLSMKPIFQIRIEDYATLDCYPLEIDIDGRHTAFHITLHPNVKVYETELGRVEISVYCWSMFEQLVMTSNCFILGRKLEACRYGSVYTAANTPEYAMKSYIDKREMKHELKMASVLMGCEVVTPFGTYKHRNGGFWTTMLLHQCMTDVLNSSPHQTKDVYRFVEQSLNAILQIHSRGLVHQDIKPANLYFDKSGNLLFGDLGTVVFDDETKVRGTFNCMSPEARNNQIVKENDLYSIGIVMLDL